MLVPFYLLLISLMLIVPPVVTGFVIKALWGRGGRFVISLLGMVLLSVLFVVGLVLISGKHPGEMLAGLARLVSDPKHPPHMLLFLVSIYILPCLFQLFSSTLVGVCVAEKLFKRQSV